METRPAILLARPGGLAKYLAQAAAGGGEAVTPGRGSCPCWWRARGARFLAKRPWVGCVLLTQDKGQADPSPERRPSINRLGSCGLGWKAEPQWVLPP